LVINMPRSETSDWRLLKLYYIFCTFDWAGLTLISGQWSLVVVSGSSQSLPVVFATYFLVVMLQLW